MKRSELIVLSYHRFTESVDEYPFSRTYEQFKHDIRKKVYDLITIDDAHESILPACLLLREHNVRAKLFVPTILVGQPGYCTWDELKELSKYHDIENHSHVHKNLTECGFSEILDNVRTANARIEYEIGKRPRYFVAPFNQYNDDVDFVTISLGLVSIKGRVDILNTSK